MAIVNMKKLTLAAPQGERDEILNSIQSIGCVEIVDLKNEQIEVEGAKLFKQSQTISQTQVNYNHVKFTYEFLKERIKGKNSLFSKREVISKKEFDSLESTIEWNKIYLEAKDIDDSLNSKKTEMSKLTTQMEQYWQWTGLDVNENDLKSLKKVSYFVGTVQKKFEDKLLDELSNIGKEIYIEKVFEKQQDVGVLIICYKSYADNIRETLKKYGFLKLNLELNDTPQNIVNDINNKINKIDEEINTLNLKAIELTKNIGDIEKIYDYLSSKIELDNSVSMLLKTQKTFILNGWISSNDEEFLKENLGKKFKDIYMVFEEPSEEDNPPVILKNNSFVEPFEAITSMYALPLPTEIDPTPVVAPFYMLFFGMMMADMGYGILMAVLGIFLLKKTDIEGDIRKIVKILVYCSIPTIIFGWLYGGFFGGIIPMKPLWVNPVDDPMAVLMVSLAIGGLGVKAYELIKDHKYLDALMDVGSWYALLGGLIGMLVSKDPSASLFEVSKIFAIIGAVAIVLTQGRSSKSIFGKFAGGLYSLYGVTGYLGDTLSYSRLLALGLSSGLIGWAFNLLIDIIPSPAKIIAGPLIFIAGHTFNFLIGGLGTFVHASRLIYLEFFGKFYEGGGKVFKPLKINTKFIKVNIER
jgi:V/A-type H+-transporting ATPase subunit I